MENMKLFRPVGLSEMEKILKDGCHGYPPRRKEQPIFYPVLNEEYAATIARDWNTKDSISGYAGFVTAFTIQDEYIKNYQVQCVGSQVHQEYWIPAEELPTFNSMIDGKIKIINAFYGKDYQGLMPVTIQDMKELDLQEQVSFLDRLRQDNIKMLQEIVLKEWMLMNTNLPYWKKNQLICEQLWLDITAILKEKELYFLDITY